jgi:hypothetical protein
MEFEVFRVKQLADRIFQEYFSGPYVSFDQKRLVYFQALTQRLDVKPTLQHVENIMIKAKS